MDRSMDGKTRTVADQDGNDRRIINQKVSRETLQKTGKILVLSTSDRLGGVQTGTADTVTIITQSQFELRTKLN